MNLNSFFVFAAWMIIVELILSRISLAQNILESELWINTTYQAEDVGIRCENLLQCKAWNSWWKLQTGDITPTAEIIDLLLSRKVEVSLNSVVQLTKFGLPKYLLSKYKIVHINFKKVCGNYTRYLLIDSISAAKEHEVNLLEICNKYEAKRKTSLSTEDVNLYSSISTAISRKPNILEVKTMKSLTARNNEEDHLQRVKRSLLIPSEGIHIINPRAEITYQINAHFEEIPSMIIVRNQKVANFYKLGEISSIFEFHKGLQIDLEKVCAPDEFDTANVNKITKTLQNSNEMESNDKEAKKNGNSKEKMSNYAMLFKQSIQLSNILSIFDSEMISNMMPLSSTLLLPLLNKSHYDSRSPPIIGNDKITEVFFGILIQSMSNFDQSTMDYDMDIWLRMAWHDRRLTHQFDRPILVNDENTLKKIWRPEPFFQNAKEARYHRMTTLNFWLYVFPNGEIFFETHIYLKPSCKLILCKYPHDNQECSLKITATSGQNSIRYNWFPRLSDAIRMNKLMKAELYVEKYYKRYCDGVRKTGNFSCLEASCRLKRSISYHITRTYIPTATCVVFSWIGVWLPEEFFTGRIFGSLTLFLTLSAESSAVKEVLPKVSYMKAIDLWFGFTASFVFITMLEALIVISLEHKSRELRKKAESGVDDMSRYQMMLLMLESGRYHSTARHIDKYCRTLYPVVFLLFLIIYYFVITEGDETKCLQRANDEL
ncbi:Neurotransmitter-gated ion-channel ligand binding domain family protein [Acanthocheilonema viteae]